ncbi:MULTISPECIES: DUF2752 domain-containing protein [Nocardiopsis]|uniref:DUF2752 domain-containing protein n=1 Tax=Nocardiopsis TaxID=2013 RepID=UPI002DB79898|nr:DUF2752 domain-containing protein [Nocardiopsis sp. LDBS1602]MEC3892128.1 DUF2752 domain-containing protein [Nocardiopsis sp. LDBS1602]
MRHDEPSPVPPRSTNAIARSLGRVHPATWPLGLGAVGLVGVVLLHTVDPNQPGFYPGCPWLALTGTFCPGCGTTRALSALTHLDVLGALSMNPLLMLFLPFALYSYLTWLRNSLWPHRGSRPPVPLPAWAPWGILAGIVTFWILRNLPWFSFLAPGTPLLPSW